MAFKSYDDQEEIYCFDDAVDLKKITTAVVWNHRSGLFKLLPNLKLIASLGAGVDHIMNDPDIPDDTLITRVVGDGLSGPMSNFCIGAILHHQRQFDKYLIYKSNKIWDQESNPEYLKGLSKKDKEERERVIKRRSKMKSNDPDAYKGFRSDKGVKTKPSKYNAKFKKMFGEMSEEQKQVFTEKLSAKITKSLKNKAKKANAPLGALKAIYNKGLAAWRTGHRPGANQHAWAMARVNSVLTGGKARKVDAAQWKQISKHRKK